MKYLIIFLLLSMSVNAENIQQIIIRPDGVINNLIEDNPMPIVNLTDQETKQKVNLGMPILTGVLMILLVCSFIVMGLKIFYNNGDKIFKKILK